MSTQNQAQSQVNQDKTRCIINYEREYRVGKGSVYVYEIVITDRTRFFVATFYDGVDEYAWGVGVNETEALTNAEELWDWYNAKDEESKRENPFRQALAKGGGVV